MSGETNGRIRMTWAQIAWAVGMIVAVLATWGDLRVNIARVETKLDGHAARIAALESRNAMVGFTRADAELLREEIMNDLARPRRAGIADRTNPRR